MLKVPDGTIRVLVQATERVRIGGYVTEKPYLIARIEPMPDELEQTPELEALTRNVQRTFSEIIEQIPYLPEELQLAVANVDDPSALSHLIAGALRIPTIEKQALLEEVDVTRRLRRLAEILARELEVVQLGSQIQSEVESELGKGQREFYLREQLKAIQRELGEDDPEAAELAELRTRIEEASLPEQARRAADRELARLERLPSAAAEHGVIRTYLEWLVDLPWGVRTDDDLDLAPRPRGARRRPLRPRAGQGPDPRVPGGPLAPGARLPPTRNGAESHGHGPILCFVGPPGVGKTSLGHSIAKALGRTFERISVGGVRDEAEIRGHRRTYIGAMPGTIIRALRDAGSSNPVFMIDEIDKMGSDFRGDPSSAMLEVLDPAQNHSFRDHYLDLPFDLSEVVFIATANTLDTIPGPLRDRMEVIELSGYTLEEKVHIAKRYLVPRQLAENGLEAQPGEVHRRRRCGRSPTSTPARPASAGSSARSGPSAARSPARSPSAKGKAKPRHGLGEARPRAARPPALLRREPAADEGSRRRDRARLDPGRRRRPVHRGGGDAGLGAADDHRPARRRDAGVGAGGALVGSRPRRASSSRDRRRTGSRPTTSTSTSRRARCPKDGPSAGVAMTTALVSLIRDRPVAGDVAMTGEITLTGQVLPVGGLKEKSLAAQRAGIKRVIVPSRNEGEILEIPEHERAGLEFVYVERIEKALEAAF